MSRYDVTSEPSAAQIAENYREVLGRIERALAESTSVRTTNHSVRLIAVSKTKSPACLQALYDCGHREFGENYVQEIVAKAPVLPDDIQWHFIGHLQSNKVKELLSTVKGLQLVQSIDTISLAQKLKTVARRTATGRPLDVYVQVNTSGEETKSVVEPGEAAVKLAQHIVSSCPHLRLRGLMTIGMPDYTSRPENFECLLRCRDEIARSLDLNPETLALSMGMSGDYENAIRMGATVVRVGTGLFGQRYYPPKEGGAVQ
uniref:Pyridoxal phosphate homeostasis protein n=1 Tax=Trypanosoma congolense (strain IL3000) TaxID=1068625 RepID=G0UMM1_TRYCI|nr:unnamed protein product [Trypanosoma congolense IL3000]